MLSLECLNKKIFLSSQDNQPKVIYTEAFAAQKLEYIHNNPVDAGIVEKAEEYILSQAVSLLQALKRSRTRTVNLKVVMIILKHGCQNSDRTNRRDDIGEHCIYLIME